MLPKQAQPWEKSWPQIDPIYAEDAEYTSYLCARIAAMYTRLRTRVGVYASFYSLVLSCLAGKMLDWIMVGQNLSILRKLVIFLEVDYVDTFEKQLGRVLQNPEKINRWYDGVTYI